MNSHSKHDCPHCSCPTDDHLKAWAATELIHTGNPAHLVSTRDTYFSLLTYLQSPEATTGPWPTRNRLTRWLGIQGYPVHNMGAKGNHLIGYQLRTAPSWQTLP